jgi:hypothetical protein
MSDRKMLSSRTLALFLLGWTSTAVVAQEQWSPDPNANNPVAVVADVQSFPIVVSDSGSGSVFAWRSARFDVGTGTTVYDIDAQRFDNDAVPQWGPTGVRIVTGSVSATGNSQPLAMVRATDGVILAWHDVRNVPDAGDIYAQKLNNLGIPQWTVGGTPVTTAFGLQDSPVVASDLSGGAIIVWQDQRGGPANSDIYAQRLNASGLPQWIATDVPVCAAPGNQLQPKVGTATVVFGLAMTWTDSRGGDQDIYAQRLSLAGGPQWMLDGVPVSAASGNQRRPVIANGPLIAWEDDRNGGDNDVYAQSLDQVTGAPLWTANGVQVASTPNASAPILLGSFIAWQDERNGAANVDIFAQLLNSSGVPQWVPNGITVCGAAGNQVAPVAVDANVIETTVAWEDARNGAADIFAQGISPLSGAVLWTPNGVAISTAQGRQARISAISAASAPAGTILVWEDDRNGATTTDIYAAKVATNGALPITLQRLSIE